MYAKKGFVATWFMALKSQCNLYVLVHEPVGSAVIQQGYLS